MRPHGGTRCQPVQKDQSSIAAIGSELLDFTFLFPVYSPQGRLVDAGRAQLVSDEGPALTGTPDCTTSWRPASAPRLAAVMELARSGRSLGWSVFLGQTKDDSPPAPAPPSTGGRLKDCFVSSSSITQLTKTKTTS